MGDFLPVQLIYKGKQLNVTLVINFLQGGTSHTPQSIGLLKIQY